MTRKQMRQLSSGSFNPKKNKTVKKLSFDAEDRARYILGNKDRKDERRVVTRELMKMGRQRVIQENRRRKKAAEERTRSELANVVRNAHDSDDEDSGDGSDDDDDDEGALMGFENPLQGKRVSAADDDDENEEEEEEESADGIKVVEYEAKKRDKKRVFSELQAERDSDGGDDNDGSDGDNDDDEEEEEDDENREDQVRSVKVTIQTMNMEELNADDNGYLDDNDDLLLTARAEKESEELDESERITSVDHLKGIFGAHKLNLSRKELAKKVVELRKEEKQVKKTKKRNTSKSNKSKRKRTKQQERISKRRNRK